MNKLAHLSFEVFGRVQGVFFRKYTSKKASELGLVGWCRNTEQGTVKGEVQGQQERVNKMLDFLKNEGSPQSKIDKCEHNLKDIEKLTFSEFKVKG